MTENVILVPQVPGKAGNSKQPSPAKHWIFTLNNYTKESIILICNDSSIKRYSFQEETGELGTPHLQGYIEFITKRRPWTSLKHWKAHWIKCKDSPHCTIEQAIAYTQKQDTRTGQLYLKGIKRLRPLKILSFEELYDWQKEIVNECNTVADDRIINWIWEPHGSRGKTQLCKYLVHHLGAIVVGGGKKDMYYQIVSAREVPDIILINLPHGSDMPDLQGLEAIKDGLFASPKYESTMYIMNSPHIFIFANMPLKFEDDDYNNKSRWKVKCLQ